MTTARWMPTASMSAVTGSRRRCDFLLPFSPCGRRWIAGAKRSETDEGYVSAKTECAVRYPSSGAVRHLLPQGEKEESEHRLAKAVYTASKLSSISATVLTPHSPIVVSISLERMSSALATPSCPPAPRP